MTAMGARPRAAWTTATGRFCWKTRVFAVQRREV